MKPSLLIIEDEDPIRKALERFFKKKSFEVMLASTGEEGLSLLKAGRVDLLLVDLMLPNMSGIEVIRQAKETIPQLVCVVMTGYGTIPSAVEAIKAGAFHYITKPFDLEDLNALVTKGLEHQRLQQENRVLKETLKTRFKKQAIIGTSLKMKEVLDLAEKVAVSDSTVLILGESGTGKELLAKAIHYQSNRSERSLVTVNCAAIPETLLESELFGHTKGSFTGAVSHRIGCFEQAEGGTIFLDEIGDMSPRLQVKVLRVLQDKKIQAIGSAKSHQVDVRIITATNRDLTKEVQEGRFREDLFYRLNVIPVTLPPLRERSDDIPILIEHFLKKSNTANHKSIEGFSAGAMEKMVRYRWPGNIRELENLVERLVVLKGKGQITEEDLLPSLFDQKNPEVLLDGINIPDSGVSFRDLVNDFEGVLIRKALQKSGGNKNKAANLLGLNRTTLLEKIKKRGFEDLVVEGHDE
ncbi:MAG: sigma-54-dependent Fis family transcriptional regulator [Deltaproteobacteria bacterium]|nr:sigma-54-dependent Fis family transcriptional regulator [Deltaproteobacteria bacterium]